MGKSEKKKDITIPLEEYEKLLKDQKWLKCLEDAGVDNWDGYEHAADIWRNENEN